MSDRPNDAPLGAMSCWANETSETYPETWPYHPWHNNEKLNGKYVSKLCLTLP